MLTEYGAVQCGCPGRATSDPRQRPQRHHERACGVGIQAFQFVPVRRGARIPVDDERLSPGVPTRIESAIETDLVRVQKFRKRHIAARITCGFCGRDAWNDWSTLRRADIQILVEAFDVCVVSLCEFNRGFIRLQLTAEQVATLQRLLPCGIDCIEG